MVIWSHTKGKDKPMTKFEKQMHGIENGTLDLLVILRERKEELKQVEREGKRAKNSFRVQCLAQEFVRLTSEYDELEELFA